MSKDDCFARNLSKHQGWSRSNSRDHNSDTTRYKKSLPRNHILQRSIEYIQHAATASCCKTSIGFRADSVSFGLAYTPQGFFGCGPGWIPISPQSSRILNKMNFLAMSDNMAELFRVFPLFIDKKAYLPTLRDVEKLIVKPDLFGPSLPNFVS